MLVLCEALLLEGKDHMFSKSLHKLYSSFYEKEGKKPVYLDLNWWHVVLYGLTVWMRCPAELIKSEVVRMVGQFRDYFLDTVYCGSVA